ncbi:3-hydroxy-3-isohexenylglutaryl-coa/hydroxy-methylglutaryl-CoA lyase [Podospora fimiseda]|uniref:hydroxymethylglutaryl-CoA lyase n=1 Tax=Podospora fimiseda TaxID=252190 RepID=A0AAN7H3N2_9PEZI|nr:3-hydroxy-3-isohexenylglutaryl-coa/hydroxy-methylglutaryl-CoA lyase [Podospora fimiseda]
MARFALTSRRFLLPRPYLQAGRAVSALRTYSSAAPSDRVKLVEVGPRDGLQNEKGIISLDTKLQLIDRLAKAGLNNIEAGSFVSPKWVPQMDNSSEILTHLLTKPPSAPSPLTFSFLAPNQKGLTNALSILSAHPDNYTTASPTQSKPAVEIAIFTAATESFSKKNTNASIAQSLETYREVIQSAKDHNSSSPLRVRAYISVVLGCPFEGYDVSPHRVAEIATELLEMGADEIALGDTTGMGTAPRTKELLTCLRAAGVRNEDLAMHFHDTYGQALVNIAVALEHGVRVFDVSVGGLGGCPYSPGATGNVATEDVVYFLESLGMDTGVDLDAVADCGEWISKEVGRSNASTVGRAVLGARRRKVDEYKV